MQYNPISVMSTVVSLSPNHRPFEPLALSLLQYKDFLKWWDKLCYRYCRNAAASVPRLSSVKMSSIFSRSTKQYTECFLAASRSRRLFVSNLLHLFYCFEYNFPVTVKLYFTKISWSTIDFKTKNGSRLIAEYVLCIYNSCWSSWFFA